MDFETFLAHFPRVHRTGPTQWAAPCPAHEDRSPSLSLGLGAGGRRLVHCHALCLTDAILAAVGLTEDDLFEAPRLRVVAGQGGRGSRPTGLSPAARAKARQRGVWGHWRAVLAASALVLEERQLATLARRKADALADPEGETAWALRAWAAELDTSATAAEAALDADLRAMHDRRKGGPHA